MKDPKHLARVRKLPCSVCGAAGPSEAHHPRGYRWGCGMGKKAHDKYVIPLCRFHHHAYHTMGVDSWEKEFGTHEFHLEKLKESEECEL